MKTREPDLNMTPAEGEVMAARPHSRRLFSAIRVWLITWLVSSHQATLLLGLVGGLYGLRGGVLAWLGRPTRNSPVIFYGSIGLIYLIFLVGLGFFAGRNPQFRREIGLIWAGQKLAALLAIGLGGLGLAVALYQAGRPRVIPLPNDPVLLIIGSLGIALAAPFIEEIIFRGLLLAWLLYRLPPLIARWNWPIQPIAVSLTALAFSLAHLGSSLIFLVALFIGGVLYATVRLKSGSILPAFAGHAAWNSAIVIGQLIF